MTRLGRLFAAFTAGALGLVLLSGLVIAGDGEADAREIRAGLVSSSPEVRISAISAGVRHSDPGIRALTLLTLLKGNSEMSIFVDSIEGDAGGGAFLSKLPTFGVRNIVWSSGGQSFTGSSVGAGQAVVGTIFGESMNLTFRSLNIKLTERDGYSTDCSVQLRLNEARTALVGALTCQQVPHRFIASIGL